MRFRLGIAFILCIGAIRGATISVSPMNVTVTTGQVFNLAVSVDAVADLFAYQFDLKFDPGVLQAVSVAEGAFLGGGGPTFFIGGIIDNVAGDVSFTFGSLQGAVPGVSGAGVLARFTFQPIAVGTTPIRVPPLSVFMLDSNLSGIDAGVTDGGVNVVGPEPSYVGLIFLLGLAALVSCRGSFGCSCRR